MLETSRLWWIAVVAVASGCAAPEPKVVEAPAPLQKPVVTAPVRDTAAAAAEARALLAQAETDVQRARAQRALWLRAWEDLVAARQALAANDNDAAIRLAKGASEMAQLGLEQRAYPPVK